MKAVGYPRVSTYRQDTSGYSIDDQVKSIEKFCADRGIELVAHFVEQESAKTIKDRLAFKAALKHLYNDPEIHAIIVTNLDRSSRSVLDSELIRQSLARKGKRLISIQEQYLTPIGLDHDTEFDEYLEAAIQHRMVEAEAERKRLRKRFMRGRKQKIEGGGWGGFRPPYEYDVFQGELVLNQERARIVRLMKRLRKYLRWKYRDIADYLNRKGIAPPHTRRTKSKRNKPTQKGTGKWTPLGARNIIIRDREYGPGSDKQGTLRAV